MIGDAASSWIKIPGTKLTAEVVGREWSIRTRLGDEKLASGIASGPQAAANAARSKILDWGRIVGVM
jgi:hypothetical protein